MPGRAMRIGLVIGMLVLGPMIPERPKAQPRARTAAEPGATSKTRSSPMTETSTTAGRGTTTGTVAGGIPEPPPPESPPRKPAETPAADHPPGVAPPEPTRAGPFELPPQLGPAWIDAGVGRIRLGLGTQLRVEVFSFDEDGGGENDVAFLVRRLRTTLSGRFLEERLSFAAQINTTAGNFELVDVWIDMEFLRALRIRFGQFKIPFDAYRQQSFSRLLLPDWSMPTGWFGAERQFGLMVHDAGSGPGLDYAFGTFTGQNRRAGHAVRLPRLYGEPVSNPSQVDGVGEIDRVHPEIVGSIRYATPGFSDESMSDRAGGPLRALVAAGGTFDVQPEEARDFRARASAEAWFKVRHVSVVALGYLGLVDPATREGAILGATGLTAQAAVRFRPRMEVAFRYAWVQLTEALSDDARDRARAVVDAAESPEDAARLDAQYADAGDLRWEHELLGGFTYFFVGHSLKWQIDLGWIHERTRERAGDDFRLRTHLQLAF